MSHHLYPRRIYQAFSQSMVFKTAKYINLNKRVTNRRNYSFVYMYIYFSDFKMDSI